MTGIPFHDKKIACGNRGGKFDRVIQTIHNAAKKAILGGAFVAWDCGKEEAGIHRA